MPPAIVTYIDAEGADIIDRDGNHHRLDWQDDLSKIRKFVSENRTQPPKASPDELLSVGDMVRIRFADSGDVRLGQVPRAQSALVSLDPKNGAIRALVGGMGFELLQIQPRDAGAPPTGVKL
jgi:penicillin-binding protein 1A